MSATVKLKTSGFQAHAQHPVWSVVDHTSVFGEKRDF